MKSIKLCYIGGGSKNWARVFMSDLALTEGLSGEIALYDIDLVAAQRNADIGNFINRDEKTIAKFDYVVYEKLEDALFGADFVVISILPGTFEEMRSDVHAPEEYGVYQPVGDTVGPGGVLRAMRTVPIYETFANAIKKICPAAWVINYTNPMSLCTKTLYDVFPDIKAFGCCHEVFHAQEFLTLVLREETGLNVSRKDIYTDASGINHFTFITEAKYKNIDLLSLIPSFMEKYYEDGYFERGDRFQFLTDTFAYGNKIKMDLYARYHALGAAGDRHLAEFFPNSWYLKDPQTVKKWKFGLTTVDFREARQNEQIEETILLSSGKKKFCLKRSDEEGVELIKALLGFKTVVTNVNMPNVGQMPQLPKGAVVETNCVFSNDQAKPVTAKPLPIAVLNHVSRNLLNEELTYEGIKERDLNKIFLAFINQPLMGTVSYEDGETLFEKMCRNTEKYLTPYFDLDGYFKRAK